MPSFFGYFFSKVALPSDIKKSSELTLILIFNFCGGEPISNSMKSSFKKIFFIISLVIVVLNDVVNSGSFLSIVVNGNITEKFSEDKFWFIIENIIATNKKTFEYNFINKFYNI